ncbi:neuraminidase-like domain-containing protein [Calothrix sp. CCY 0018]|uniref:Tc toxin subunit A-related protein n=1 Tax=Calothrix sp. CCY 0018 TaxID=3103864 RepID=UPI0039C65242
MTKNNWLELSQQIHNELNVIKRDALVPYVISHDNETESPRDLYEKLLIDVEMGSCGTTSKIKEAIAATQLYFHRYFVNLENIGINGFQDEEVKSKLKEYWKWMRNYRVWEANRKVFLYPENYIRPELRDTKTPGFQTLEEDLLQGEITLDLAAKAFKKYLDEYTEVSRLTIAGGYVYDKPGFGGEKQNLVLFGRTKTDPRRYYYRQGEFLGGENGSSLWEYWSSVNIKIDADRVYPVFAFNRVFVFWSNIQAITEDPANASITTKETENTQTVSSQAEVKYLIDISFSFYNLNKEWVPAQTLAAEIKEDAKINDVQLFVENSNRLKLNNNHDNLHEIHENIVINCSYKINQEEKFKEFRLTPELYTEEVFDAKGFSNSGIEVFTSLFDEPAISPNNVVMFNAPEASSRGAWFSFDHKGGSFLCKPDVAILNDNAFPQNIGKNNDLPKWDKIDAAFMGTDSQVYFFDNTTQKYVSSENLDNLNKTRDRWGKIRTNIQVSGIVDSAFIHNNKLYLFSGNEYLVYSQEYDFADFSYPKSISTNNHAEINLPKWNKIDAALKGRDGNIYFFKNSTKTYVASNNINEEKSIQSKWGKVKNSFTVPQSNKKSVETAFIFGDKTYLINEKQIIRYTGGSYQFVDNGFPIENSFYNLLEDLGYQNNDESHKKEIVDIAFVLDSHIYFIFDKEGRRRDRYYKLNTTTLNLEKVATAEDKSEDANWEFNTAFTVGNTQYKFKNSQLTISGVPVIDLGFTIDTAFAGRDNNIYIFRGQYYIVFSVSKVSIIVEQINNWSNPQPQSSKWGRIYNKVAADGIIDAAFVRDTKTYLFSGDEYLVYSDFLYEYADEGYPKQILDNTEDFPQWNQIGAAFTNGNKSYFFQKKIQDEDQYFVESSNLNQNILIKSKWGKVSNNFLGTGIVDSAYIKGNYLFMSSGNQFIRYTLTENQQLPEFVDSGYPKQIKTDIPNLNNIKIDAAFTLGNENKKKVYIICEIEQKFQNIFFAGIFWTIRKKVYFVLYNNQELDSLAESKNINGSFGNIPQDLIDLGFDAALNKGSELYLFQNNQYIKYPNIDDDNEPRPYEITDIPYEIIRLTTSTAYKLNQRLFAGGIKWLLSLSTQETDELPSFSTEQSTPTQIKVKQGKVTNLPISSHLDFNSANGLYYWEVFFHAPFLIAQSLNTAQKFAEAKEWYEYIFDPTEITHYWKFLPFLAVDIQAIITSGRTTLAELKNPQNIGINVATVENDFNNIFTRIEPLTDVFQHLRQLSEQQQDDYKNYFNDLSLTLRNTQDNLRKLPIPLDENKIERYQKLVNQLHELTGIIDNLWYNYDLTRVKDAEIQTYLDDPFDPHAIANLRKTAYRKSIVMAYIDNIIDWGDMLFRQYTSESIDEARMLYILAYDLLGKKPESLGTKILSPDSNYTQIPNQPDYDDFRAEPAILPHTGNELIFTKLTTTTPNDSVGNPYFFVPENPLFNDYWNRVEDRLRKIRSCQNILGIAQPLPLFEPPIDPMALVNAVSSGAGLSSALASITNVEVPHYRFSFLLAKAKELVAKLNQFSGELLGAIEKQDAEELTLLQNKHESVILAMTQSIKEAQLEETKYNTQSLNESLNSARQQVTHYSNLISDGLLPTEAAQIALMIAGSTLMTASAIVKTLSAIAWTFPKVTLGPFSVGVTTGGDHVGEAIEKTAEALETGGDALSTIGEVIGIFAQHQRSVQDWELQKKIADSDVLQITAQIEAAKLQEKIAQQDLLIHLKQIEQQDSITTFMKGKFTNTQLYQWMVSKLSAIYYQTYQMAYDMSKAAEKAFQFERGLKESEVNYINGLYWDSQKKGLLAGYSLDLDLDRMEKAYYESYRRGFEITKNVSLIKHDPVALFELKRRGSCTFALNEADFDYDYPGHYNRQIKTVSITFNAAEGEFVNAILTQLTDKTVLEPDLKAVKYLMEPKDLPPLSIRSGWKANQQIAFSHTNTFTGESQGLFELNFNDERYLPFEGTGAISTWELELKGKRGSYNLDQLTDITVNVQYTAMQGGKDFALGVKGMLKPYQTTRYFNIANEFANEWGEFLDSDSNELILTLSRDLFPDISSSKISGIYTQFDLYEPGEISMMLNNQDDLPLQNGKYVTTPGLNISNQTSNWVLTIKGDKQNLRNINLVVSYQAKLN